MHTLASRGTQILLAGSALFATTLFATSARAGIPECNGLRLENAVSCEIRGNLDCSAGCEELGVFKKACATKLHTVCRDTCTLDAEPTCTDECTESCTQDCDNGVSVICAHNCFGECVGSCSAACEDAEDPSTCQASCEATCDGECDIQCEATVDGSCYQHCIECCGGSCGAQANMSCQTECQQEQFESCEYEFRADCDASCTGDGALFCDGEFIMQGSQLGTCLTALLSRGVVQAQAGIEIGPDGVKVDSKAGFCSVGSRGGLTAWGSLVLLGLLGLRSRRR